MPKIDATQKAIIAELLASDADLRELAKEFVRGGLADLINLQKRGDPRVRAEIARSLAGPITSAITEVGEEDSHANLRAEMQEMMAEMQEHFIPPEDNPPHHVVPKS